MSEHKPNETYIHWWAALTQTDLRGHRVLGQQDWEDLREMLRILIKRGLDVNEGGVNGSTPLHRALQTANPRTQATGCLPHNPMVHIRLLLDHGADPKIKTTTRRRLWVSLRKLIGTRSIS